MRSLVYNMGGFLDMLTFNDIVIIIMSFIIIILLLIIYYLLKDRKEVEIERTPLLPDAPKKEESSFNIYEATKSIEESKTPKTINLTSFEEEQEANAIISFDELVKSAKKTNINYEDDDEYQNFEVKIRKIDLSESAVPEEKKNKTPIPMMTNGDEGDFLVALKKLQRELDG